MASSTTSLLSLPPELILEIADYLPPDGVLALKFSHRVLCYSLPLVPRSKRRTLSRCAALAIRSYLCQPNPRPTHLRCILCKAVYPLKSFQSSSSPACAPISFAADVEEAEVVELPQRLCAWHVGRLARIVHTEPGGRNEWIGSSEEMCMHCGAIQSWTKCDCTCDSCSIRTVTAYTRYLNNNTECRKFVFYRQATNDSVSGAVGTQLYVRETCFKLGTNCPTTVEMRTNITKDAADQNPVIYVPVRYRENIRSRVADDVRTCTVASRPTSIVCGIFVPPY